MHLFVTGATGRTGKLVVEQALAAGHQVTAYVRSPQKLESRENLTIIEGDVLNAKDIEQAMKGADAVISCLGSSGLGKSTFLRTSAQCMAKAMKKQQITRIAYVASAGIHRELPGIPGRIVMYVLRHVLEDHRHAVAELQQHQLAYTIARPLGLSELPAKRSYRTTLEGIPSKPERMIARADVASFLLHAAQTDEFLGQSVGIAY